MKKIILGFLFLGLITLTNAQTVELSETVIDLNNKYLNAVDHNNAPKCVKYLEEKVVNYRNNTIYTSLYNDEYDTYKVSFNIPEGEITAVYNINGKIVETRENYNDVRLPLVVLQSIAKRFPNWGIIGDAYYIKYQSEKDTVTQEYKIKIKNEDEIITVKTNENGLFL
ncbi:nicotinate-nucleotide adenylyltransferase [Thalassobellus citreus]|uniref:nicotinate-nucleotide adenylyltransferase n=1 Tax=Thalassobellus citreus TaxID=3367752 RepID=UPI0037ABAA03